MKLQLVEYNACSILRGTKIYIHALLLDERCLVMDEERSVKLFNADMPSNNEIYNSLIDKLLSSNTLDLNLEHYYMANIDPSVHMKVLFEKEVPDTYLKDLYIESRKKSIDEDFN
jgi:uncharacterized protein (DUF111 family)